MDGAKVSSIDEINSFAKLKEVADIIGIGLPLVKYRIGKAKELLSVYLGDKK